MRTQESPGGMVVLAMTAIGALLLIYLMYQPARTAEEDAADEMPPDPPAPPRNFTIEQLHVSVRTNRQPDVGGGALNVTTVSRYRLAGRM